MISKRLYIKPEVTKVPIDTSLVLMQPSNPGNPRPPMPMGGSTKGGETPFASPFDDKPFG